MIDPGDYSKNLLLIFEKSARLHRIDMAAYATKTNRRKLINAYSDKSPIVAVMVINEEMDIACYSSDDRVLVFNTSQLQVKTSRSTQGVAVMTLKPKRVLTRALPVKDTTITNISRYRVKIFRLPVPC